MKRVALGIVFGVFVLCQVGNCQDSAPADWNWDFSVWTAAATGEEDTNSLTEAQVLSAGVFIGKTLAHGVGSGWRRGNLEYGFSVSPLFLQLKPQKIRGIAFDPIVLRWNSDHPLGRATPYIELGGGGVHTSMNLPAGNTSTFNFTPKIGGGISLPINRDHAFDVGVLWSHISNANLGTRNPEFNGIEIRFAYHWHK